MTYIAETATTNVRTTLHKYTPFLLFTLNGIACNAKQS